MCICKGERHVVREQHGEFSHAQNISHLTIISLSNPPFCEIWKNCRKKKSSCVPAQCDVVKTAGNMKIHQCLETIELGTQMRTNLLAAGEVVVSEVVLSGSRRLRDDIRHECVQLSSGLIWPSFCTVCVYGGMKRLRIEYEHTGMAVRAEGHTEQAIERDRGSVVVGNRLYVDLVLFSSIFTSLR
jgi:hypothetical protein